MACHNIDSVVIAKDDAKLGLCIGKIKTLSQSEEQVSTGKTGVIMYIAVAGTVEISKWAYDKILIIHCDNLHNEQLTRVANVQF